MRKMFGPLDDVLIERLTQPVARLLWDQLGVRRSGAACLCIDIAFLAWIISRAPGLLNAMDAWHVGSAALDATYGVLGVAALSSLRILFHRTKGRQGDPLRPVMQPYRAIVLLMLVARFGQSPKVDLADVADITMLVFATSALYLAACKQPPPLRRRRREPATLSARPMSL